MLSGTLDVLHQYPWIQNQPVELYVSYNPIMEDEGTPVDEINDNTKSSSLYADSAPLNIRLSNKKLSKELSSSSGYSIQESLARLNSASVEFIESPVYDFNSVKSGIPEESFYPSENASVSSNDSVQTIHVAGISDSLRSVDDSSIPSLIDLENCKIETDRIKLSFNDCRRIATEKIGSGFSKDEIESCFSGSCIVPAMEEMMGFDQPVENVQELILSGLAGDITTRDYDTWTDEEKRAVVNLASVARECGRFDCEKMSCARMTAILDSIESSARDGSLCRNLHLCKIVWCIGEHSFNGECEDELTCNVPWCNFFFGHRDSDIYLKEKSVAILLSYIRQVELAMDTDNQVYNRTDAFHLFDDTVTWPYMLLNEELRPLHGNDYIICGNYGRFGKMNHLGISASLPAVYLLLNTYQYIESSDKMWSALATSYQDPHPKSLPRFLWVLYNKKLTMDCLQFCPFYRDFTLDKYISNNGPITNYQLLYSYMSDLLSAVKFLSGNNILYLSWKGSSIAIDEREGLARLIDFSCACTRDCFEEDEDLIDVYRSVLNPLLIPPEMFESRIGEFSDIWGVGCAIYNLISGHTVHSQHRHMPREELITTMENYTAEGTWLEIQADIQDDRMRVLLQLIFTGTDKRMTADDLLLQMTNLGCLQP